jgi:hypothetical protein
MGNVSLGEYLHLDPTQLTIEISRNSRCIQTSRGYRQRATQVHHTGNGTAMDDIEAVLIQCERIVGRERR